MKISRIAMSCRSCKDDRIMFYKDIREGLWGAIIRIRSEVAPWRDLENPITMSEILLRYQLR